VVIALLAAEFARLPGQGSGRLLGYQIYSVGALTICLSVVFLYLRKAIFQPGWRDDASIRLRPDMPAILWIFPIAILLQGAQPHLGFKNIQSFAMFSNLDTESGQSNHYIIPASWQISGILSDPVEIHDSNLKSVRKLKSPLRLAQSVVRADPMPELTPSFLELKRVITRAARRGASGIRVSYTRNGEKHTVMNAEDDPELAGATLFERFYLRTRPLALSNHGACRW
jgi:hypothetical protein